MLKCVLQCLTPMLIGSCFSKRLRDNNNQALIQRATTPSLRELVGIFKMVYLKCYKNCPRK